MKILVIVLNILLLTSCNDVKEAIAHKEPLLRGVEMLQPRGVYTDKTSTIIIFHWPTVIDWETEYFDNSMSDYQKRERLVEGVTYYSTVHDQVDVELVKLNEKLTVWNDNECFFYDEIDEDGIPEVCVELWEEGSELEDLVEEKINYKSVLIDNIRRLLDADFENAYNWKINPRNKEDSVLKFGRSWNEIENIEIHMFGPLKLSYTIKNGGIKNVSVDENGWINFYLYEKASVDGPFTGIVYKYELAQDTRFLKKHRLKGKIHKYDAYMNLIQENVGICKIEFDDQSASK